MIVLVIVGGWGGLTRVHNRNEAAQQAATQYARGNFAAAASLYQQAVEVYGGHQEELLLNLAQSYARAGRVAEAQAYYGRLLASHTRTVRGTAQQQLAVLRAQQGEYAQAVGLLRQALLTNPRNANARYNYEVLSNYLARNGNSPHIPSPAAAQRRKQEQQPLDASNSQPQAGVQAGNQQQGQLDDLTQPDDPRNPQQAKQAPNGQRDPNQQSTTDGSTAQGGFQPGVGTRRNVASGTEPGTTRGLDTDAEGSASGRHRAGTDPAMLNEAQLQTQRARLQQMNLSTGQARQLLEAMNTAEQQYLQQIPHKAASKPAPSQPAW
ncbi:tetratricopeptide repeat protein [Hymenobacter sp. GOD-10R]|uniref:tetratricopeptide repeat protein n=1 Tax=Hymenobacter sp. GOD-10R TaxID=3093922 RepID=UPI002D79EB68|nr:tetratricopeptide repeat protein [Hymenobacter sp. GOD-10R]WRQ26542.1 tetratricopeptide repeat protein [Hymenobacter sp. GOD-10R]